MREWPRSLLQRKHQPVLAQQARPDDNNAFYRLEFASARGGGCTMRTLGLLLLLVVWPLCGFGQSTQSESTQSSRQQGVAQRGDHVMGFSHDATAHHFRLLKDGGEIIVSANDPNDKSTIDAIQMHLGHIATMFSEGNFQAPMLIHDTNPPGVASMIRLKSQIRYEVSNVDRGAKVRIVSSSPDAIDAVHAFLLFQIIDHHTGDPPSIAE
jgi:hypothetical protein